MVAAMDHSLGALVQNLKKRGMWEDTLLIVTTDNGGDPNFGGASSSAGCNYPLRAGKARLFEGGVRAIGFVSGGRNVLPVERHGAHISGLAHIVDWFPTVLELANASHPASLDQLLVDGQSLVSAIVRGSPTNRTHLPLDINLQVGFPNWGSQFALLTHDGWKLIVERVHGSTLKYDGYYHCLSDEVIPAETSLTGQYLFNVLRDPTEQHNLYHSNPRIVSKLHHLVQQYQRDYRDPQENIVEPEGLPSFHDGVWAPFLDDSYSMSE
jgi:arylsulfatase A-like enzyme